MTLSTSLPPNAYQPPAQLKPGGCGCGGSSGGGSRSGGNCGCGGDCGDSCGLERVRFFPRQLLGADDLNAEQHYFREKQRRHNRYLHGWGVVCGAHVRPAPTATKPYQVMICPGYVITPQGDEIMIGAPALYDLATCMVSSDDPCAFARPCPPVTASTPMRSVIYLSICYKECEVRPVRVSPGGCNCDDVACDYSRIRDAYEFSCLDCPPQVHGYNCAELCRGGIMPCPPCPPSNCVVLATIRIRGHTPSQLPAGSDVYQVNSGYEVNPYTAPMVIDNLTDRKLLYSTAMLQTMAMCQCGDDASTPVLTQVATPVIVGTLAPQTQTMVVSITDAQADAVIHYTTDLSDPTADSATYTGQPLNFTRSAFASGKQVTVKAIATATGYQDSEIATYEVPKPGDS